MIPVYIPSKGRPDTCRSANIMLTENIPFKIFVEPQDYTSYLQHYSPDNLVQLQENDKGVAYVRREIKKYSIQQNDTWHWQVDDDMISFQKKENDKRIKVPFSICMTEIENYISEYDNIGIATIKYDVFAFAAKDDISFNKLCCGVVVINNSIQLEWRDNIIEDVDYTLQVLDKGYSTVCFNYLTFNTISPGKQEGGCTATQHDETIRTKYIDETMNQWPNGFLKVRDKNGRITMKANRIWSKYPQRPNKKTSTNLLELFS